MDSVSGVGVLDKAMAILLAAAANGSLSLLDIQQLTGQPRATAHRLAVALEAHGLLRRDPEGRFLLGLALIAFGDAAAATFPLPVAARPILEQLRNETGESVQLYVREGDMRRCVVSLQSPHGLRWIVPEGALLPLDRGSAGRVLSSAASEATTAGGWVESIEERERGVASVSAAVIDHRDVIVAAVSVSGPLERLSVNPGSRYGATVLQAARSVGELVRSTARPPMS
jgi:DNA-binding IclR family transcriptional regulator